MTQSTLNELDGIEKLRWIMAQLRDPNSGCPWDIKQTFHSIVPHTLEEAYEVADAIEKEDFSELSVELGDLLFQVIFYAQLGKEQGYFDFDDIVAKINDKLIRRHPHVFAGLEVSSEAQIKANWENSKAQEREQKSSGGQPSVLDDIPLSMPALSRANKIQKRCANIGFDWSDINDVFAKVQEEISELQAELVEPKHNSVAVEQRVQEELGDLMFAMVNLARHLRCDPETTLRRANLKFERRFRQVEQLAQAKNIDMKQADLAQLDRLWEQIKQQEKG